MFANTRYISYLVFIEPRNCEPRNRKSPSSIRFISLSFSSTSLGKEYQIFFPSLLFSFRVHCIIKLSLVNTPTCYTYLTSNFPRRFGFCFCIICNSFNESLSLRNAHFTSRSILKGIYSDSKRNRYQWHVW